MIVRLLAVEGESAFSPPHTRIGQVTPIGHTRQPDGSLLFVGGVVTLTLDGDHQSGDLSAIRKDVVAGRLKVADSATARALDVPFVAEKAPPVFDAAEPVSALTRKEK